VAASKSGYNSALAPFIEQASEAIAEALPGLRGVTLMVDGTRSQAPFERITADQYAAWEGPKQGTAQVEQLCLNGACGIGNEPRME